MRFKTRSSSRQSETDPRNGQGVCRGLAGAALAILVLAVVGRADSPADDAKGVPSIHITQIRSLPAPVNNLSAEIETRWIARIPKRALIQNFQVLLEVRYSDGSQSSAHSDILKASTRSAILRVPAHSAQNSNAILKEFKARVKAMFKMASSFTIVREVAGSQFRTSASAFASAAGAAAKAAITFVNTSDSCSDGQPCLEVRWTIKAGRNVILNDFIVTADVLHANGDRSTHTRAAASSERQTRFNISAPSSEVKSVAIALLTNFYFTDSATAMKEGAFQ